MQSSQKGSREPGPASAPERKVWAVWEDVRRGAEHFRQRNVPLPVNRLGQFVHGLCLPFQLARAFFADRAGRWRYLKVCGLQALAVLALAMLFTGSGKEVVEPLESEEFQGTEQVSEWARIREEKKRELTAAMGQAARAALQGGADLEKARAAVEEAERAIEKHQEAKLAARQEDVEQRRAVRQVVYWAAFLSALQIAQWIVTALSRDYHTVLSLEVSQANGVALEDEPLTPRIRLNMPWLRSKMKRRWRALLVFAVGVPILWGIKVLLPEGAGNAGFTVLLSAWGAWWFVVFTAGKSSRAWDEQTPREPWFLRGWNGLTTRVVPLRWALFGVYGSLWANFTRPVFAPVASVERQPWVFSGLAVVRALAVLPVLKCFLRPLIPVAAAHLLAQGAVGEERKT